jgi:uncharacterized damage-inducible protein DinB
MLDEAVRASYAYNHWATERILDTAAMLSADQWQAPGSAGHGSIRDTLVHLISTQKGWLAWWDGSLPPAEAQGRRLDPQTFAGAAELRPIWQAVEDTTAAFTAGLGETQLAKVYTTDLPNGSVFRMPLWQMMLHVANHGTQHRSEVAAMLTAFGRSPGDLDMVGFFLLPGQ